MNIPAHLQRAAILLALAANAAAAPVNGGRAYNIDFGLGDSSTPASSYGASAGQLGTWNLVGASETSQSLIDVNGSTGSAPTFTFLGGGTIVSSDDPSTSGGDQHLMDDALQIPAQASFSINGLINGEYGVIVYAWGPNDPAGTTSVSINGLSGGDGSGGNAGTPLAHEYGDTYLWLPVSVSSGAMNFTLTALGGFGYCNGIQIVPIDSGLGAEPPSGAIDITALTQADFCFDVAFGMNSLWVYGEDSGQKWIYRLNATASALLDMESAMHTSFDLAVSGVGGRLYSAAGSWLCEYRYDLGTSNTMTCYCYDMDDTNAPIEANTVAYDPVSTHVFVTNFSGEIVEYTAPLSTPTTPDPPTRVRTFPQAGRVWTGLGWDPARSRLWASYIEQGSGMPPFQAELYELNPATGQLAGPYFIGGVVPGDNLILGGDVGIDPLRPDTLTYFALHNQSSSTGDWLLKYDVRVPLTGLSYCTSGTTTNGCLASMSSSGLPLASMNTGFTLLCSGVEGQKQGLIFYGLSGPNAAPFGGSTSILCVKARTQRMFNQSSGGTAGQCDGALSEDFLQYKATFPGSLGGSLANLVGQDVNAQAWFRDPPSTTTTALSDGFHFIVCP